MRKLTFWAVPCFLCGIAWSASSAACGSNPDSAESGRNSLERDSLQLAQIKADSIRAAEADSLSRYESLTDEDFQLVADELGVEVAAMKAVVSVEAGTAMKGFYAPGVPVVNFDPSVYRKVASKAPSTAGNPDATVPEGLSGYALKEWTQLTNARKKNAQGADMGTFWGMFQIGGFNYKKCGCASVDEFVKKMSYSELSQLELFADFIVNTGMLEYLKNKDWNRFARAYNGPSYASKGYHTKMARAYKKYSGK